MPDDLSDLSALHKADQQGGVETPSGVSQFQEGGSTTVGQSEGGEVPLGPQPDPALFEHGVPADAAQSQTGGVITLAPERDRGEGSDPPLALVPVKDFDFRILAAFGAFGLVGLALFFLFIWSATSFLAFPDLERSTTMEQFHLDALIYRERRMAFALTLRTFITGLSFIVGLALCTQGGIFILRQVMALTTLTGSYGRRPSEAGGESGTPVSVEASSPATIAPLGSVAASVLRDAQFAFGSYSPGVVFMLGGVLIVVVTQWLAIPVRGVELVPAGSAALCQEAEGGPFALCEVMSTAVAPVPGQARRVVGSKPFNGGGFVPGGTR